MPANPHAYDDLPQVYAEEISARRRGILRILRRCAGTLVFDRSNGRRSSLAEIEYRTVTVVQHDVTVLDMNDFGPARGETQRKSSEAARRAGRRGGAATKARWARIKAGAPESRRAA
jgi:hypothetical protein